MQMPFTAYHSPSLCLPSSCLSALYYPIKAKIPQNILKKIKINSKNKPKDTSYQLNILLTVTSPRTYYGKSPFQSYTIRNCISSDYYPLCCHSMSSNNKSYYESACSACLIQLCKVVAINVVVQKVCCPLKCSVAKALSGTNMETFLNSTSQQYLST